MTVTGSGAMSLNEIISIRQIGIPCACRAASGSWQMTFTFVAVNILIKKFEFSRIECDACLTFPTFPSLSLFSPGFPIYGRGGGQEQDRSCTEVSRQIKSSRNIKKIEARSLLHHKPRRRTHTHAHRHRLTRVWAGELEWE